MLKCTNAQTKHKHNLTQRTRENYYNLHGLKQQKCKEKLISPSYWNISYSSKSLNGSCRMLTCSWLGIQHLLKGEFGGRYEYSDLSVHCLWKDSQTPGNTGRWKKLRGTREQEVGSMPLWHAFQGHSLTLVLYISSLF